MADAQLYSATAPPIVRSLRWIGLALAVLVAAIGGGLGFWQALPAQYVIFTAAATLAIVLWVWNAFFLRWIAEAAARAAAAADRGGRVVSGRAAIRGFVSNNRGVLAGLALLV